MVHPKEEKTVVLVKPDGVKRGLIGEIVHRIEQRGLKIIAMKMILPNADMARDHYPNTEIWMHGIPMVRKIVGATLPSKAEMGTIRGDYSVDSPTLANADKRAIHNLVHASGDEQEAAHEIEHWFKPEEIHVY